MTQSNYVREELNLQKDKWALLNVFGLVSAPPDGALYERGIDAEKSV